METDLFVNKTKEQIIEKAKDIILCARAERRWHMCIPAQWDDVDVILYKVAELADDQELKDAIKENTTTWWYHRTFNYDVLDMAENVIGTL